jgi:hypothetical protein
MTDNGGARMMRRLAAAGIGAALLAAPSAQAQRGERNGEADLARIVAGRVAGKPVDCIHMPSVRSTRVIAGTAIVYDAGRTIYVNRPRTGAESLRRDDVLVTRPNGSQLCSVDIVRLVDSGSRFQRGSVGLGQFVPYTRPRR